MPTFAEQIADVTAKLDVLATASAPEQVTMTAAEALVQISTEIAGDSITKERAVYLRKVLRELEKSNFEATTFVTIKVLNDPTQLKPETEVIDIIENLAAAKPDSSIASNLSAAGNPDTASMPTDTGSDTNDFNVGKASGKAKAGAKIDPPVVKVVPPAWPRDMASAKFDPVKKAYAPEPNVWGPDSSKV